ncbi:hypothetical protein BH23GEM11_BH23GEM11_07010 [soil metagenome]
MDARSLGGPGPEQTLPTSAALSVPELLEVGREVGIAPESVLLGLAESRLPDAPEVRPRRSAPAWQRILIDFRDALEVSVVLPLPPAEAREVVDSVLTGREFRMHLEDRIGDGPRGEEVRVYRTASHEGGFGGSNAFHSSLALSDARVLLVSVVGGSEGGQASGTSRLRMRMPLFERGTNLAISGSAAGVVGASGAAGGVALGEAAAGILLATATGGLLPLAIVAVPAAAGALLGMGGGILGFRRIQGWGFGKGEAALRRVARALHLAVDARAADARAPTEN